MLLIHFFLLTRFCAGMQPGRSVIQPSKYFILFWRIFPENGSGIPESVKREMKDAEFILIY
jgi:hypothetical protein